MKKILFILLCMSLAIVSCSCNVNNSETTESIQKEPVIVGLKTPYESTIVSGTSVMPDTTLLPQERSWEKENMPDRWCFFDGQIYMGTYQETFYAATSSRAADQYRTEDDCRFALKEGGALQSINFYTRDGWREEQDALPELENAEQYAIQEAERIAKQYIENLEDYQRIVTLTETYSHNYYNVRYVRMFGQYESSDRVEVNITTKGRLYSVKIGDLGIFGNYVVQIDEEALNNSVYSKLAFICSKNFEIEEIREVEICVAPKGTIYLRQIVAYHIVDDPFAQGVIMLTDLGARIPGFENNK